MKKKAQDKNLEQLEMYVLQSLENLDYAMSLARETIPDLEPTLKQLYEQLTSVHGQSIMPFKTEQPAQPAQAKKEAQIDPEDIRDEDMPDITEPLNPREVRPGAFPNNRDVCPQKGAYRDDPENYLFNYGSA